MYDLPKAFDGCWEGTIEGFDSVTPLSFSGHFVSKGMKVTYQLCYRRTPNGGHLDLTKIEIEGKPATVTRFDNYVTAVNEKQLTGHLKNHVVLEQKAYVFWIIPVSVQQEIFADEDLTLTREDLIAMRGDQLVKLNGSDIARMTFHADFHKVPGAS